MLNAINSLTAQDILYAALLAFCVTWFINNIIRIKKVLKAATTLSKSPKDIAAVMERCYALFPMDKISFQGETFTRGMQVKVTTNTNADFEGEFIGGNSKNMVCIRTKKYIIAHEICNIRNMIKL